MGDTHMGKVLAFSDLYKQISDYGNNKARDFSAACDLYMDGKAGGVGETDQRYINRLRSEIGDCKLDAMTTLDIEAVITRPRINKGLSNGAIRRELNTLQAILNYATDMGLTKNRIKVRKTPCDGVREVWLSIEETREFLSNCSPVFKPFATFLFCTGARMGEARAAKWEGVRNDGVLLTSRKGKDSKIRKRMVPILPTLRELIGPNQPEGYILKCSHGHGWGPKAPYRHWNEAREKSGLPDDFTPHCARHTFASLLIEHSTDSRTVAELLGHSSMDMMKRYTHLSTAHLLGGIKNLGL